MNMIKKFFKNTALITTIGFILYFFSLLVEIDQSKIIGKIGAVFIIVGSIMFLIKKKWK